MTIVGDMQLTGFAEAQQRLAKMAAALQGTAQLHALEAAALIVQNDAKRRAPVLTSTLSRSIHMQTISGSPADAAVAVGTDVPYARRIEFGFMNMTDSLGRLFHQPAQPYLRPALDENRAEIRAKYDAVLRLLMEAR
jgi:HK97 gp10 family phage protein